MSTNKIRKLALACGTVLTAFGLSACDLAPTYTPPTFIVPASWHGQGPFAKATPADTTLPTDWWKLLNDPLLNEMEATLTTSNADLQASAERFIQARALVVQARSELLPHLALGAGAFDNKQSEDRLFRYKGNVTETDEEYHGLASWEPDFWSAIRNHVRAQKQYAQEKAADFAMSRLSLQAELASDYVQLRGYDAQIAIYNQSIGYYQKALQITQNQLLNQAAPRLDVARAQAQLYSTQAAELDVQAAREVTEHAIAILTNASPSSFHIAPTQVMGFHQPNLPAGIPSELLQRRPDIASAEREMAQANREIGIARAAFYPHVSLQAGGGFAQNGFDLANLANSLWSYGASFELPIFEGGLRRAELQHAWSAYRETRDNYRSKVLDSFREVEDGLSRTSRLDQENRTLEKAVDATLATQNMTMTLYQGGIGTYLEAIFAQVQTLETRIHQIEVATRLYQADIGLIRALGGGWNVKLLPTMDQTLSIAPLQYDDLHHPQPVGGVNISQHPESFENLSSAAPQAPAAATGKTLRPIYDQ
ncbi:efflux transporter outer membrane subunit [Asaia lannensis]|uniref:Efflux transporter outer membrane subunit n=1 Tax=Asaia lannensis NBRC 102526 TaxID=1307926 RepID=A0ABT1CIX1_9PROT|nr:efflux transporter outer membrane subunit [Asaia lannensis]MCO6160818.1 efflux transporter outer membrane subunit [Asaia lannensis NBRC 102526]GBQ94604.1 secretion system type I outer membrane efflux pump lipoprotein NodT [Asaia lannensis NBRC 102526]